MRLLLAAVMLAILSGCVVYGDGYYGHHDDGWWYPQRGGQNDQGEDD